MKNVPKNFWRIITKVRNAWVLLHLLSVIGRPRCPYLTASHRVNFFMDAYYYDYVCSYIVQSVSGLGVSETGLIMSMSLSPFHRIINESTRQNWGLEVEWATSILWRGSPWARKRRPRSLANRHHNSVETSPLVSGPNERISRYVPIIYKYFIF